jgi:hypothetical protein
MLARPGHWLISEVMRDARRLGRRAGQVVYYVVVGAFAFTSTWQTTRQVFFPDTPAAGTGPTTCEDGVRSLQTGIEAATRAANRPKGDEDEEAALLRFRSAISSTWAHREAIGELCQDNDHQRLLDALDRLRYSEEHGVRKQATELSALRLEVAKLAVEVLGRPPTN